MAFLRRQSYNFVVYDDQSPAVYNDFVGNWTRGTYLGVGLNNDTYTATSTVGSSLTFTFSGTQVFFYGGLSDDGTNLSTYPAANYVVDGSSKGSQNPVLDSGGVLYFQTSEMGDGSHTLDITVTKADENSQFIVDYFLVVPGSNGDSSGVETTRATPPPTAVTVIKESVPVGPIVGGVIGGVALIAILCIAALYFISRRRGGGRAYYFEKPDAADVLAAEAHVEPFNATPASPPPSSIGFSRPGPQSAYSDGSSAQPLNPSARPSQYTQSGPSDPGLTYTSSTTTQPRTGKAALIAQQHEEVQPVQFQDSGIRFNQNGEQAEAGPSQLLSEVPPTYTPN